MTETVLITGASSGIGYELSKIFAKNGYDLVIIARDGSELKKVATELKTYGSRVKVIQKDLSDPKAPQEIFTELEKNLISVDILVNNAGFGLFGLFAVTDLNSELKMIDLNVRALTHLTKLFLKPMLKRKKGRILNIASTAAFQPGPLMSVYFATKAYVLHFSEALANELQGTGVTVTALCPGPTKSKFTERANMQKSKLFRNVMDVGFVAHAGYAGLIAGKTIVIPGIKNKLLAFSVRLAPRSVVTAVARYFQEEV
ncbi:SDR family oxidoreductase [Candidatus Micrarchaeota archaeon]|nr:SDR family oxidoreductase [Candidatus Micrarchaeota archaeon]